MKNKKSNSTYEVICAEHGRKDIDRPSMPPMVQMNPTEFDDCRRDAAERFAAWQRKERAQWVLTVILSFTLACLLSGGAYWYLATHFSR